LYAVAGNTWCIDSCDCLIQQFWFSHLAAICFVVALRALLAHYLFVKKLWGKGYAQAFH